MTVESHEVVVKILGTVPDYVECEIVRCRDCAKWSYFDDEDGVRFGDCAEFSKHEGEMHATRECGFCYWGKRKEGGE